MRLFLLGLAVLLSAGAADVTSDDLSAALDKLKQAEGQKDFAQIKKLAVELLGMTRQVTSEPAPQDATEKENWTNRVAFARETGAHAEYALSSASYTAPNPVAMDLLTTLERQSPKSKYLEQSYARYFQLLTQTGAGAKIPAVAEKALANFPDSEDLLLVLADSALARKQSGNAFTYARRLVAAISRHPQPEGMSAADWERKKAVALGHGYWIVGMVSGERNQFFEADKNLRAALPLIKGNDSMMAGALYYLGVANYNLGKQTLNKARVLEAARFSEQSAAIEGPFQQNAWHNATVMKQEAAAMR